MVHTAYLEHILDAYDAQDELLATPIIRVITFAHGAMSFWNFTMDSAMFEESFWQKLLLEDVKKSLLGNIRLQLDSNYARYSPSETKEVSVAVENLTMPADTCLTLHITIQDMEQNDVYCWEETISAPFKTILLPQITQSSLYRITASVYSEDILLARKEHGFWVMEDTKLLHKLQSFQPLTIDKTISTDYCLQNGETTAILGTTYFVTDSYRQCFYHMNAWLCYQEMAQLNQLGFNVLRSGNWYYIAEFYNEDGSIGERGIRALQTYFLNAALNGFTVQFVLGNVLLNQWDLGRSPIHNADMRKKCMCLVASFAQAFKDYPNVTLDIVNEPSYSQKGAWTLARPSEEPEELLAYQQWLQTKYGKIAHLHQAWGENSYSITDFTDVKMPETRLFSRGLFRTEQRINHTVLADFFAFARHEFLNWTHEIREVTKQYAPNMTVIMGRDETLRIPSQQDELLAGNIDMICWHQWHNNSDIITEYLLNRVRGNLCIAQELGMYKYDDIRGGKRHTDEEMARALFKKLLYSFGNFVQWQAHDDPYMFELSENSLGLYRADLSPTPSVAITQAFIEAEKKMQKYVRNRKEDAVRIATLHNTSYHFSVDNPIAHQGIRNHTYALYHGIKEPTDFVLEHQLSPEHADTIGTPRLFILPAMQTLSHKAWEELLHYVENGSVAFISGCIDQNEFFAPDAKIATLDKEYHTEKLLNFAKLTIGEQTYALDFRPIVNYGAVTNILNCGNINNQNHIMEYPVGRGCILYCPYPVELSSNMDAICACYQYAIEKAQAHNLMYQMLTKNPQIIFHAASYEGCTVYTFINEGFEDTISWIDLRSGKTFRVQVSADHGGKLWISPTGDVLNQFGAIHLSLPN